MAFHAQAIYVLEHVQHTILVFFCNLSAYMSIQHTMHVLHEQAIYVHLYYTVYAVYNGPSDVGQHGGNSKPGNEAAQKSLDRRAAHCILTGAPQLLKTRAVDPKLRWLSSTRCLGQTQGRLGTAPMAHRR